MATAPFLADLTRVRGRAREHSAGGAAATASRAEHQNTVLRLLNDILASELIWLMRYRRRYVLWGGQPESYAEGKGEEPTPADRLARRIVELGGVPDLDPDHLLSRTRADYASRGSVADMVREDLRAERIVIDSYSEVLRYLGTTDPRTREMLDANLRKERARAAQLAQILRDLDRQSIEAVG